MIPLPLRAPCVRAGAIVLSTDLHAHTIALFGNTQSLVFWGVSGVHQLMSAGHRPSGFWKVSSTIPIYKKQVSAGHLTSGF
jgi:hypothetical protein